MTTNCGNFKKHMDFYFYKNKMHQICPYTAMFPPKLANILIKKYSKKKDKICDPFSGRGTTLLEGLLCERKSFASDLNPLAFVLSKSKIKKFKYTTIDKRLSELEKEYKNTKTYVDTFSKQYMNVYFSAKIMGQLMFFKKKLGVRHTDINDLDNYILANLLGILHGPTRKDNTSMYCSIGMSNTTVMSRNYVKSYSQIHDLKFPNNENVFDKIRFKIKKSISEKHSSTKGEVRFGNATDLKNVFPNQKFNLILTSPPYLNIFNYTKENWIRMWMLGFEKEEIQDTVKLDDKHKYNEYKLFLEKFLISAEKVLKNDGKLILIIGDVRNEFRFLNLWDEIKNKTPFEMTEFYYDEIDQNKKSTNKNGIRAGKATRLDNICVFTKKHHAI